MTKILNVVYLVLDLMDKFWKGYALGVILMMVANILTDIFHPWCAIGGTCSAGTI